MGHALAQSTRRSYNSAQRRYLSFCHADNVSPLPACQQSLCRYVTHLANEGLAHASIKCYLAAIRHLQIEKGWDDPGIANMAKLELVLRGIKMVQASKRKPTARQPITVDLLQKMRGAWINRSAGRDEKMLWAAASLCFAGFLRSGEITVPSDRAFDEAQHLTVQDVAVDSLASPSMLRVKIKASKTDPFRLGVDVFVGHTGCPLCPVTAMLNYLIARGSEPGPLFMFADKKPLTRPRFVERTREALRKAGVDSSHYSGHSFRSGAATTAAMRGINDATIKLLGRWKSEAYHLYVKTPRAQLSVVTQRLLQEDTRTCKNGRET